MSMQVIAGSSLSVGAPSPGLAGGGLDESRPMQLADTAAERRALGDEEELFAIMVTTEALENAYIRDLVPATAYKAECARLLRSYDLQLRKLRAGGGASAARVADVRAWMASHNLEAPQAYLRLECEKLPATDTHYSNDTDRKPDALAVSETTSALIQALDAVHLGAGRVEVDRVAPYLASAVESLNRHAWLPADVKVRLQDWKRTLGAARASDVLTSEQERQMLFDIESTYNNFRAQLGAGAV